MKVVVVTRPLCPIFNINSKDLINYIENEDNECSEDQVFPELLRIIKQMLREGGKNDISLGVIDLMNVLSAGDLTVFASAKGSNIDEMIASLTGSMTDNGVLDLKSCLLHLTMHSEHPIASLKKIVNYVEIKLATDENHFYFGTQLNNGLSKDTVMIQMIVSI